MLKDEPAVLFDAINKTKVRIRLEAAIALSSTFSLTCQYYILLVFNPMYDEFFLVNVRDFIQVLRFNIHRAKKRILKRKNLQKKVGPLHFYPKEE